MPQCRCLQTRCRRSWRYRSCEGTLPPASLRRGVRRVVPRRARPVAFPFAPGVSAGWNGVDVEVRKDPWRPVARVPGHRRRALWELGVGVRSDRTDWFGSSVFSKLRSLQNRDRSVF
jgi:hypothetical protein